MMNKRSSLNNNIDNLSSFACNTITKINYRYKIANPTYVEPRLSPLDPNFIRSKKKKNKAGDAVMEHNTCLQVATQHAQN